VIICRWTPDGVIVRRQDETGRVSGEGLYPTIGQAVEGVRILLQLQEDAYLFPPEQYPTTAHRDAEMLARGIENRLHEIQRTADGERPEFS
jgi:hypothetical protein